MLSAPDFTFFREDTTMSNYEKCDCTNDGCECTPNSAINCSVTSCAHHCKDVNRCGLTSIQVGTHEQNPSMNQCTDCQSFKKY